VIKVPVLNPERRCIEASTRFLSFINALLSGFILPGLYLVCLRRFLATNKVYDHPAPKRRDRGKDLI